MKPFRWNDSKNEKLRSVRGIKFEDIVVAIEDADGLLGAIEHPNQERYPNQIILVVNVGGCAYAVPSVVEVEFIFLKTAYPSRVLTQRYLGDENATH